ncbi:hypothetical protein [Natrialba sp. INN-245]|uniref:hypothetical protein n=1 Tax=Natrialba sp. INN-245 TaxID=2690967 RepID=UPI001313CC3C|nr:hypothetical protein [Natrialba sp. INN-245]MWV38721.1 hypothetical protein [Natrialba sp. INN-245]
MTAIAQAILTEWTETAVVNVFGFGLLTGVVTLVVAFAYRRYSTRSIPAGAAVLVGLAVVGLWINVVSVRQSTIIDETPLFHHATATYFLAAFAVGSVAAAGGRRIGDAVARESANIDRIDDRTAAASVVRRGRLSVEYRLPEEFTDLPGSPPVENSVKRELAGESVLVPCDIPADSRVSRLENRLERDFGIGHVAVDLTSDGAISRVRLGRKRVGIGSTIAPNAVALAVRGVAQSSGSTGERVEIWTDDECTSRLVATGTLRATSGDVATIVTDAERAEEIRSHERYRIVTRPASSSDIYELLSTIRALDHTVAKLTVSRDGPLEGEFVGWLSGTVVGLVRNDETIPFPAEQVPLEADDDVYILGTATDFDRLPVA